MYPVGEKAPDALSSRSDGTRTSHCALARDYCTGRQIMKSVQLETIRCLGQYGGEQFLSLTVTMRIIVCSINRSEHSFLPSAIYVFPKDGSNITNHCTSSTGHHREVLQKLSQRCRPITIQPSLYFLQLGDRPFCSRLCRSRFSVVALSSHQPTGNACQRSTEVWDSSDSAQMSEEGLKASGRYCAKT
jgi:hypothetical protein